MFTYFTAGCRPNLIYLSMSNTRSPWGVLHEIVTISLEGTLNRCRMIDGDHERSVVRWRRRLPLLTCVRWLLARPNEGSSCRQKGEGRSRVVGSSNHQWGGTGGGAKSKLKTRPSSYTIIGCNTPRRTLLSLSISVTFYRSSFFLLAAWPPSFLPCFFFFLSLIQLGRRRHGERGDVKSAGESSFRVFDTFHRSSSFFFVTTGLRIDEFRHPGFSFERFFWYRSFAWLPLPFERVINGIVRPSEQWYK